MFVDLKKAYDTVPLKKNVETLMKIGLNTVYVKAIWNLWVNFHTIVMVVNYFSNSVSVTKGLKQGCSLPPTLFKIYLEAISAVEK